MDSVNERMTTQDDQDTELDERISKSDNEHTEGSGDVESEQRDVEDTEQVEDAVARKESVHRDRNAAYRRMLLEEERRAKKAKVCHYKIETMIYIRLKFGILYCPLCCIVSYCI